MIGTVNLRCLAVDSKVVIPYDYYLPILILILTPPMLYSSSIYLSPNSHSALSFVKSYVLIINLSKVFTHLTFNFPSILPYVLYKPGRKQVGPTLKGQAPFQLVT